MIDPDSAAKAREIAERLWIHWNIVLHHEGIQEIVAALEAERKAGREEGNDMTNKALKNHFDTGVEAGRQAALDEAAKIADKYANPEAIAIRIRRLGEKA